MVATPNVTGARPRHRRSDTCTCSYQSAWPCRQQLPGVGSTSIGGRLHGWLVVRAVRGGCGVRGPDGHQAHTTARDGHGLHGGASPRRVVPKRGGKAVVTTSLRPRLGLGWSGCICHPFDHPLGELEDSQPQEEAAGSTCGCARHPFLAFHHQGERATDNGKGHKSEKSHPLECIVEVAAAKKLLHFCRDQSKSGASQSALCL